MKLTTRIFLPLALALFCATPIFTQEKASTSTQAASSDSIVIPPNSKVFIETMENGFDTYLAAALRNKKVPLLVVSNKEQADFEIKGTSETKKAGTAKIIFGSGRSEESASIQVINLKTGIVAYADSSHRKDALRGKRSTSEKLAEKLNDKIKSGK